MANIIRYLTPNTHSNLEEVILYPFTWEKCDSEKQGKIDQDHTASKWYRLNVSLELKLVPIHK